MWRWYKLHFSMFPWTRILLWVLSVQRKMSKWMPLWQLSFWLLLWYWSSRLQWHQLWIWMRCRWQMHIEIGRWTRISRFSRWNIDRVQRYSICRTANRRTTLEITCLENKIWRTGYCWEMELYLCDILGWRWPRLVFNGTFFHLFWPIFGVLNVIF